MDAGQVEQLMGQKVDAVLSTLGVFLREPGYAVTDMTRVIVAAMQKHGVDRFICMSSLGVGDSKKLGGLVVKYVTGIVLRHVLVDKNAQEALIKGSGLQWTLLRPPRILPDTDKRDYHRWQRGKPGRKVKWQITRADAAGEMLNLFENDSSVGQTWHISI